MKEQLNISSTAKATMMFTLANLIHYGCSLLYSPVFARIMTQEEYGVVTLYSSWMTLLTTILTLNVWSSAYIGFVEFKEDKDGFSAATQKIVLPICGLAAVALLLFPAAAERIFVLPVTVLWFLLLNIIVTPSFQVWSARQRYEYRYKAIFAVSVMNSVAVLLIGVLAVFLFPGNRGEARIFGSGIIQFVIYVGVFALILSRGRRQSKRQHYKFIFKMSLAQLPNSVANSLLSQTDRIMIAQILGESATAVYGMAGTISGAFYTVIMTSINSTWVPSIFKLLDEGEFEKLRKSANYLTALVALCCFLLVMGAPEAIWILGGKQYSNAKWCVPGLVLSLLFSFVTGLFGNVQVYHKKPQYICVGSLLGALSNIALNAMLIPRLGAAAASYTSLLGEIIICFANYWMMRYVCQTVAAEYHLFDVSKIGMICAGTVAASILGSLLLYEMPVLRYLIVATSFIALFIKRDVILGLIKKDT